MERVSGEKFNLRQDPSMSVTAGVKTEDPYTLVAQVNFFQDQKKV